MEAVIRKATISDAESIGNVHYQSWIETYTGLLPETYLATRSAEQSTTMFRKTGCQNLVVAEIGNKIIGFCGWGELRDPDENRRSGEIQGIYLLDAYKRNGLGQKMLEYALVQLNADDQEEVGLWVLDTNESAIRFYEKAGFAHTGKIKTANMGETITELFYTKKL